MLVNCSLKTKSEPLQGVLKKFSECQVVDFSDVDAAYQVEAGVDALVISGSAARIVNPSDRAKFENVAQLIAACQLPILGICFGHQLLCWSFGAKTGSLGQGIECFENVRVIKDDNLFIGLEKRIPLAENHFDYVQKDGLDIAGFVLLADSASCEVEAVRHKNKPFFGTQFHPERISVKGESHLEGHEVIRNFYRYVVKR